MDIQGEKVVYVAIDIEGYEGFSTMQWVLRKWGNQEMMKIVILHVTNTTSKHYVYTPLGKLRTSSVNEEKLRLLNKNEDAMRNRVLAQYIALCGRVEVEVMKIEIKEAEPLHKQMVEVISNLGVCKLVVSLAFMKASSMKSRSAISGTFYVIRNKASFCEVFVICEGQRIFLKEESEEDDAGKNLSTRNWFGRKFLVTSVSRVADSPPPWWSNGSPKQWENCRDEIMHYAEELMSVHQVEGEIIGGNSIELCLPEKMNAVEMTEVLKRIRHDAQGTIELNINQARIAKGGRHKAQRAITICNAKDEELQTCLNMEMVKKVELNKMLDIVKAELVELCNDLQEKRSMLQSILELHTELFQKLNSSSSAKELVELQLEKTVEMRADMVTEIEELKKQKDILHRRIEFCKDESLAKVSEMNSFGFNFREFSGAEIIAATKGFSLRSRLKSASHGENVFRGRINNHLTVAVKVYMQAEDRSMKDFTTKVKLHSQVQHPNILAMIGFCSQLNSIVYEYMHNGTLHDALFSTGRSWQRINQPLTWHARICIAAEVCSALGFLHKMKPNPIIHGSLRPTKILLNQFNVAKVYGLNGPWSCDKPDITIDIRDFGNLALQLMTGNQWSTRMDVAAAIENLDHTAGEWPMDLALELSKIANKCLSKNCEADGSITTTLVREINSVKKRADQLVDNGELLVPDEEAGGAEAWNNVPGVFLCPIYQDVMQNPHIAADGFSYELEAIEQWLKTGHDTSPMTNLKLQYKLLLPNRTLRSLIDDWKNKRSTACVPG